MTTVLHQFTGPWPDLSRIHGPDLDLTSDLAWLRDNPKALARIRAFRDETRKEKRVILLTVRLLDLTAPDGWRLAYVEAHPGHWGSDHFQGWQQLKSLQDIDNGFALTVLTADADADGGHALTVLQGLVLPDATKLTPFWRPSFAKVTATHGGHDHD